MALNANNLVAMGMCVGVQQRGGCVCVCVCVCACVCVCVCVHHVLDC